MAKQKKDRSGKRYVKRDPNDIKLRFTPWKLVGVFSTPLAIVDQLEHDHTVNTENDVPVFRDINDGKLYETLPALGGFIGLFELYSDQYKHPIQLDPIRKLYRYLAEADDEAMTSDDTAAVRATIDQLRSAMLELTQGQANELLQDYKLKEALQGNIVDW